MNTLFIGIGGFCSAGVAGRQLKLYEKSLPFDFIRCKFSSVIYFIDNNFINFLPTIGQPPDVIKDKLIIYFMKTHTFYHHDLLNNDIYEAFNRRINRFINVLIEHNDICFYRAITSQQISDEINLRTDFYNVLCNKYPLLNFKIIFISFIFNNNIDFIYYKSIDSKSVIFYIPIIFSQDHITSYCANCIEFIKKHGFITNKIKINVHNLDFINDDFIEVDKNELFLDNYV